MKRTITLLMLALALLVGATSVDAKTTKKKSRSRTSHSSSSKPSIIGNDRGLFDVHGSVKSIKYNLKDCLPSPFFSDKIIFFAASGECTNLKQLFKETFADSFKKVKIKRNKKGQLTVMDGEGTAISGSNIYFTWNDNLLVRYTSFDAGMNAEDFSNLKYDGNRIAEIKYEGGMGRLWHETEYIFTDFVEDSHGNWIECQIKYKNTTGDSYDEEEQPETTEKIIHLKRTIEYY